MGAAIGPRSLELVGDLAVGRLYRRDERWADLAKVDALTANAGGWHDPLPDPAP